MRKLFANCWNDDAGSLLATEFLFIASVLTVGVIVGLTSVRNAINLEMANFANSILALNQGYVISGQLGCGGYAEGTAVLDIPGQVVYPINTCPTCPVTIGTDLPCQ